MSLLSDKDNNYFIIRQNSENKIIVSADQNICSKCNKFIWIINLYIQYTVNNKNIQNKIITLCNNCMLLSDYIAKEHLCYFHNKHIAENSKICYKCINKLQQNTAELYNKEVIFIDKYNNELILRNTLIDIKF